MSNYKKPPKWCPFKVKNFKQCKKKCVTHKHVEGTPLMFRESTVNCTCKYWLYKHLIKLAPTYSSKKEWEKIIKTILE